MNKAKISFYSIIALALTVTSCTTTAKDEPKPIVPTTVPTTVTDIDGNIYHTVTIGTQTWMVENLKTTKYRNGNLIGTTSPATKDIRPEITPKYQWAYDGNETNVAKYGRLYTWYAVTDSRNIAPTGWHIATDAEWTTLTNYVSANLGTSVSIAKALASTTDWTTYITAGTIGNNLAINNYSGFSALPGGSRSSFGSFDNVGYYGVWWSSTESITTGSVWVRGLGYCYNRVDSNPAPKLYGYSVRCVWDF